MKLIGLAVIGLGVLVSSAWAHHHEDKAKVARHNGNQVVIDLSDDAVQQNIARQNKSRYASYQAAATGAAPAATPQKAAPAPKPAAMQETAPSKEAIIYSTQDVLVSGSGETYYPKTSDSEAGNNYNFVLWAPFRYSPTEPRDEQLTNRSRLLEVGKFKYEALSEASVRGQDADFSMQSYDFRISAPVYARNNRIIIFDVDYEHVETQGNMRLNNTDNRAYPGQKLGAAVPDELKALNFALHYRDTMQDTEAFNGFFDNWTFGFDTYFGSNSDVLFNSLLETQFNTIISARIPIFERQFLSIMGAYLSDLKYPIGGFAYQLNFGKTSYVSVGMPMSMAHINSADLFGIKTDRANLDFQYIYNDQADLRLSWDFIRGKLQAYSRFKYDIDRWKRANREDDRMRIFYRDMRWGGGVRVDLFKHIFAEVEGGWAFSRVLWEGRNTNNSWEGFDLNDSAYLTVQGGITF